MDLCPEAKAQAVTSQVKPHILGARRRIPQASLSPLPSHLRGKARSEKVFVRRQRGHSIGNRLRAARLSYCSAVDRQGWTYHRLQQTIAVSKPVHFCPFKIASLVLGPTTRYQHTIRTRRRITSSVYKSLRVLASREGVKTARALEGADPPT